MMLLLQSAIDSPMPVATELPALISSSALTVSIIQWMKTSNHPIFKLISQESAGLNRVIAWIMSLIAGVGIHYHWDSSMGALTITGLTGTAIMSAAISATKSYGFTWFMYNMAIKNRAADVAAVAGGVPVTPVVGPGVAKAGIETANEGGAKP